MSIRAVRNLAFVWLVVAMIVAGRSAAAEARATCEWTIGCHVVACESDEMGGLGCAGTCSGCPACDDAWAFCESACAFQVEFFSCNEYEYQDPTFNCRCASCNLNRR